jgi:hypothetical protein
VQALYPFLLGNSLVR